MLGRIEGCATARMLGREGYIESGEAGVFSGYAPPVAEISAEMGMSARELWSALGERRLVAGQESMIREIAQDLMNL